MTSLVTFGIAVFFWYMMTNSLQMAFGMIALITVHEFGHFYAARMKGLRVSLPMFTPLGAAVQIQQARNAADEAFVALAGPVVGGLTSIALMLLSPLLASNLLFQLGYWGVILNLFNLVPLEPLDGGKISLAIERRLYFLGIPLFLYFMMQLGLSQFNLLIGIFVLWQAWQAIQLRQYQASVMPSFFNVSLGTRCAYAAAFLASAALLAWVTLAPTGIISLFVALGL